MMPRSGFTSVWGSSVSPTSGRSATNSIAGSFSFSCSAFSTHPAPSDHDSSAARMLGYAVRCPDEVDFGDAPIRVEIYASEETVEIFIEADFDTLPEERRRFALLNIPATCLAKLPPQRRDVPQALS